MKTLIIIGLVALTVLTLFIVRKVMIKIQNDMENDVKYRKFKK